MVSGCYWRTKNCFFRSLTSPGFSMPLSGRFFMSSVHQQTICIGLSWMWTWRLSLFFIPRDSLWSVNPMPELGWIVRRKDPSNCSTNPGRSAGQAFCKHVFWIYPRGMSAGVPGAGNFGALRTPISAPGFTQNLSVRTVSASPADRRDVRRSRSSRFVPVRLVERREACRVK
jgi:hypothetical protein